FAGLNWFAVDRSLRYHVAPLPLVALLAASLRRPLWLPATMQAAFVLGTLVFTDYGRERHLQNHRLMDAVRQSPAWHGQSVYTDVQIARYDTCSGVDAWMLANDSIAYDVEHQLSADNGQRDAIVRALERQRFLVTLDPIPKDALYLIESERNRRWAT